MNFLTIRALLAKLPEGFTGIRRITLDGEEVVIASEKGQELRIGASRLGEIVRT